MKENEEPKWHMRGLKVFTVIGAIAIALGGFKQVIEWSMDGVGEIIFYVYVYSFCVFSLALSISLLKDINKK